MTTIKLTHPTKKLEPEQIPGHVSAWKESKLSIANYCRKHQINYDRFRYHIKKSDKQKAFSKVILKSSQELPVLVNSSSKSSYDLTFPDKSNLSISGPVNTIELKHILIICKEVLC